MLPLFASPWAFAALLALPTLAGLYYLRNSYRRVNVSSLMLWLDAAESRASGLKVKRLRTPLLFFLELAILALLALAATGPRVEIASARPPIVLVLDDSFSMLAGGDDSPRARAIAAIKNDVTWASTVRFVIAGPRPQALGEVVDSWAEAKDLLDEWKCRSPSTSLADAIGLATELGGDQARILVITDHAPERPLDPGRVVWWAYGQPRPNQAILRASRGVRENSDRLSLGLANFSEAFKSVTLAVESIDGAKSITREKIDLKPNETRQVAFQLGGGTGPVRVFLDGDDALALDDEAFLVPDETPPIRVDVRIEDAVTRELFEKALEATGKTLPPGKSPHLIVSDAVDMPEPVGEAWVLQVIREKDADAFIGPFVLDRVHPLTAGLNLAGIVWGAGKTKETEGTPIAMAGNVPLITDVETPTGQHRLRFRWRPDLSTLQQSPNWPILVWNLVTWRGQSRPGIERVNLRLGEPAVLSTRTPTEPTSVVGPTGSQTLAPRGSRVVIPATDAGVYEVTHAGEKHRFAVSSLSADESDLKDAATGVWGEWRESDVAIPGVVPLAWILLLLALAILVGHQILANRGG